MSLWLAKLTLTQVDGDYHAVFNIEETEKSDDSHPQGGAKVWKQDDEYVAIMTVTEAVSDSIALSTELKHQLIHYLEQERRVFVDAYVKKILTLEERNYLKRESR